MTRGLCLALLVCTLTAGCLVLPHVLGFACVAALAFLYLLTPIESKASAGRSSGEAESPDRERGA